jgi:hypothetical protein
MKILNSILLSVYFVFLLSFENCFGQKIDYNHFSKKEFAPIADSINKILKEKNLNLTIGIAVVDLKYPNGYAEGFYSFYSNNKIEDSIKNVITVNCSCAFSSSELNINASSEA